MNKKQLSETDIRSKFITPALTAVGWDLLTLCNQLQTKLSTQRTTACHLAKALTDHAVAQPLVQ